MKRIKSIQAVMTPFPHAVEADAPLRMARQMMRELDREFAISGISQDAAVQVRGRLQGRLLSAGVPAEDVHTWINAPVGGPE